MRNELSIANCPLSIVNYKNMEVPIIDFDDIRPLNNDEVKDAIESLIANEDFERAFRYINPDVNGKSFQKPCVPSRQRRISKRSWHMKR